MNHANLVTTKKALDECCADILRRCPPKPRSGDPLIDAFVACMESPKKSDHWDIDGPNDEDSTVYEMRNP